MYIRMYKGVYLEILETILRRKIKFSQFYQVNANCANYDEARNERNIDPGKLMEVCRLSAKWISLGRNKRGSRSS